MSNGLRAGTYHWATIAVVATHIDLRRCANIWLGLWGRSATLQLARQERDRASSNHGTRVRALMTTRRLRRLRMRIRVLVSVPVPIPRPTRRRVSIWIVLRHWVSSMAMLLVHSIASVGREMRRLHIRRRRHMGRWRHVRGWRHMH